MASGLPANQVEFFSQTKQEYLLFSLTFGLCVSHNITIVTCIVYRFTELKFLITAVCKSRLGRAGNGI